MKLQAVERALRLGARGSILARMQSQWVADALEKNHPGLSVELMIFKTTGDIIADRPLHELGGKGLFTRELEQALLEGAIDLAVHSYKDVPVTMPLVPTDNLSIVAVPARESVADVLVASSPTTLPELPVGSRVGTGSLRRRCQVLALRPDLVVEPIRGNIDTRLKKQSSGEFDAVILAMAGLRRAALFDASCMTTIPLEQMLPAAGQGALALQCRRDDAPTRELLLSVDDPVTHQCVLAERHLVQRLNGDCHSPIAVLGEAADDQLTLRAVIGGREGNPPLLHAEVGGALSDASSLADELYARLAAQGAHALLGTAPGASP